MENFKNGFNKQNLNIARSVINKHLEDAAKELGFSIQIGSISFDNSSFTTKITATKTIANAVVVGEGIGETYKSPNSSTKYSLVEFKGDHAIVKTMRRGGKRYKVDMSEFKNWLKVGI